MNIKPFTTIAAIALLLSASGRIHAETIDAGPFSVEVSPVLNIRCNDVVLFSGDRSIPLRDFKKGSPSFVGPIEKGTVTRKGNIITTIVKKGRNIFRREVMVTPKEVHITYETQVFGPTGSTHMIYTLLTPVESLDKTAYSVTKGQLRRPRKTSDDVFDFTKSAPFVYLHQTALYWVLKDPKLNCTIDFNPLGQWQGINNYGENWSTSPYHDNKHMHFAQFCSAGHYGGTFTGKVVIRTGNTPYETIHSNDAHSYTTDFPVKLAINFSDNDTDQRYQQCSAATPDDKDFGWQQPQNIRIVPRASGGLLRRDFVTYISNNAQGKLDIKLRSGIYLLTLNVFDPKEDTGPFNINGPAGTGTPLLKDIQIPRGQYWNKSVPIHIKNNKTTLQFTGKWKINALSFQLLQHEEEDFYFNRPYWNMDLKP
jgi:hypothetical protein